MTSLSKLAKIQDYNLIEVDMMQKVIVGQRPLSLEIIGTVASLKTRLSLSATALARLAAGRRVVERIVRENRMVYGITTGFGKFAEVRISLDEIDRLQENLIKSHATGVGQLFQPHQESRLSCFCRPTSSARGLRGSDRWWSGSCWGF